MKKIYTLTIAVLVALSFRAEALPSVSHPKCWMAARQCKTLEGIKKYEDADCIYKKGSKKLNSECHRAFCSLNCRQIIKKGQKCPEGELLEKCNAVCKTLDYGNEKIRTEVDACIGGVMTGDEISEEFRVRKTAEDKGSRGTKRLAKGTKSIKRWLSEVKKLCDERNKTYVSAIAKIGKGVTIADFTTLTSRLENLSEELQQYLDQGKLHISKYPREVNKGYALVHESTNVIGEYINESKDFWNTIKKLEKANNVLKKYPSGTDIEEMANPSVDPTEAMTPSSNE